MGWFAVSVKEKVEWYNRKCRWPGCEEPMEDLSKRVYCNDHLDRVLELIGRAESGYYGPLLAE